MKPTAAVAAGEPAPFVLVLHAPHGQLARRAAGRQILAVGARTPAPTRPLACRSSRLRSLPVAGVPQADVIVVAGRRERLAVGRKGDGQNAVGVRLPFSHFLTRIGVEEVDGRRPRPRRGSCRPGRTPDISHRLHRSSSGGAACRRPGRRDRPGRNPPRRRSCRPGANARRQTPVGFAPPPMRTSGAGGGSSPRAEARERNVKNPTAARVREEDMSRDSPKGDAEAVRTRLFSRCDRRNRSRFRTDRAAGSAAPSPSFPPCKRLLRQDIPATASPAGNSTPTTAASPAAPTAASRP